MSVILHGYRRRLPQATWGGFENRVAQHAQRHTVLQLRAEAGGQPSLLQRAVRPALRAPSSCRIRLPSPQTLLATCSSSATSAM